MNNFSNSSAQLNESSSVKASDDFHFIVTVILRFTASLFLLLNFIVLFFMFRNYKKLNNTIYLFMFNLAIPDIAELIAVGFQIFDLPQLHKYPTNLYMLFHIQMSWYLTVLSVLGLSVNRFIAVLMWKRYDNV